MRIEDKASQPSLRRLGVNVQGAASQDASASEAPEQRERLTLAGLQLQQFESAYMVLPGARRESLVIDPQQLDASRLLESLQQLGRRVDLDAALDLHGAASSLISAIRGAGPDQAPLQLVLTGPFGEIALDLERLQPDALRAAFETGLQEQPSGELRQIHQQLGPLSQRVRAGFGDSDEEARQTQAQTESWLSAVNQDDLGPEGLFSQTLGYNPLNEQSGVKQLLQALNEVPDEPVPTQSELDAKERAEAEAARLAEQLENLVAAANALEDQLALSPRPQGSDISELLRHFLTVLRQLDREVNALLRQQSRRKQFDHGVLSQYADRLHRDLRLDNSRRDSLRQNASERLSLLLNQSQTQLQARLWLARQGNESLAGLVAR